MIYISEEESSALVSHDLAFTAASDALIAACKQGATTFPVVLGHGSVINNRFTIKSGSDADLAGLKVGSYFPSNDVTGLPRHSSIIFLFDQTKGRIGAIVEGSRLNAYRTSAADAVATDALAKPDATVLAVFGTGHQAEYDAEAVARIRSLEKVLIVGRSAEKANELARRLREKGLPAEMADAERACRKADIVVTATTAREPLFKSEWVRPGTHISSMGSDGVGKQELPPELFAKAKLFCDYPEQSLRIGEFQHAGPNARVIAIGVVMSGAAQGRSTAEDITVFDSSGIALQDLYIANEIIKAARKDRGL